MPSTPPPDPVRADARANRAVILDTAIRLFGERGVNISHDEIAAAAGLSRTTLYRHFPTRELLFVAISEKFIDDLETLAASLPKTPDRIFVLLSESTRIREQNLLLLEMAIRSASPEQVEAQVAKHKDVLREPFEDAVDAGLIPAHRTLDDVMILLTMVTMLGLSSLTEQQRTRAWDLALELLASETSG